MSTPDLAELVAMQPTAEGSTVHLALPGYRPGKKERGQDNAPLCSAFVHRAQTTGSLAEAILWAHQGYGRRFCRSCIGHLCYLIGVSEQVVRLAMLAQRGEPQDGISVSERLAAWLDPHALHG